MSTHSEATRLNLEYYRKQAKALLKSAQSGEPNPISLLARQSNQLGNGSPAPALHDAQLAIAREQGFSSWPRFQAFITQSALDFQNLVAAFIGSAVSDLRRAEEMLLRHPAIAEAGFYAALVLGNSKEVERALAATPSLASGRGGPRNWEPLLYVCFSRYASAESPRAAGLAETAQTLLRHGSDPNALQIPDDMPDNPLSCLYAATGLNNNPALGLALLEARANPNDSESLYHSTEHSDLVCLKLLLRYGATPHGTNALKHMLDREDIEGLRLLLGAGANPNELNHRGETALHWAVWRGRSVEAIAALLDAGADLEAKRHDGRTAYAMAVHRGRADIAALLEARGAKTDLSTLDRFLAACVTGEAEEVKRLLAENPGIGTSPDTAALVPDLAMSHSTPAVRALLAAGMPVNARGEMGATALHWACWKGYADLVELLLDHGAALTIEDEQYHGTPPGWFGHGLHNCH
jgi:ankyrin repeat protein